MAFSFQMSRSCPHSRTGVRKTWPVVGWKLPAFDSVEQEIPIFHNPVVALKKRNGKGETPFGICTLRQTDHLNRVSPLSIPPHTTPITKFFLLTILKNAHPSLRLFFFFPAEEEGAEPAPRAGLSPPPAAPPGKLARSFPFRLPFPPPPMLSSSLLPPSPGLFPDNGKGDKSSV